MSVIQCTILNDEIPIKFAKEELNKYAGQVQHPITYSFVLGLEEDFIRKGLIDQSTLEGGTDAFQLLEKESEIYIIGSNPRLVLFGVYHACKKLFGYKWVSFISDENIEWKGFGAPEIKSGKMKRRGLVVENYDDTTFLLQLIDWAAKHKINELFFTFMLWDKVKHTVADEIKKRGLTITLGGHSMHYLIKDISHSKSKQVDFTDDGWKSLMISKIKGYCEETDSIKRLSLWPADIGIKDNQDFLTHYIEFIEQIHKHIPGIQVEHIAYNAGLSWEMLELQPESVSSETVDTLYAFWGRNYNQSFKKEDRAYKAFQKWCHSTKANQRQLAVFEYYSDHFMLGDLFPPLFHRIREDIELYSSMGIEHIVNLIVPYFPKENPMEMDDHYPWKLTQLMNSYFFARLAWGDPYEFVEDDFYSIFEKHQIEVKQALNKIEGLLSEVSKWNVPLFPSRLIDPEKVEMHDDFHLIIKDIKQWKSDIDSLKLNDVDEITDPYSLVAFYINYISEKLGEYLCKWEEKAV